MRLVARLSPMLLAALAACSRPPAAGPAGPVEGSAEPEATSPGRATAPGAVDAAMRCDLTTAELLIDAVELRSADGRCKLFVPVGVAPGRLAVRVAASGDGSGAALEASPGSGDERWYATEGEVTVEQAAGRLRGTFKARDANPPGIGEVSGQFDAPLPGPTP